MARELVESVAYSFISKGNELPTAITRIRLSAMQYLLKVVGIELPLTHYYLPVVKATLSRESAL